MALTVTRLSLGTTGITVRAGGVGPDEPPAPPQRKKPGAEVPGPSAGGAGAGVGAPSPGTGEPRWARGWVAASSSPQLLSLHTPSGRAAAPHPPASDACLHPIPWEYKCTGEVMRHGSPPTPGSPELRGGLINTIHEGMQGAEARSRNQTSGKPGPGDDRGLDGPAYNAGSALRGMGDGVKKGPQGHKEAAEIRRKKYNGRLRGRN